MAQAQLTKQLFAASGVHRVQESYAMTFLRLCENKRAELERRLR